MSKNRELADQIEESAEKGLKVEAPTKALRQNLLSTGSTLLNLACSENPYGGFLKGKYYFLVGDSASGKTFLSMTCFAEATQNKHFKDYRFIYDNVEDGMLMNVEHLFNEQVADRIEPPGMTKDGTAIFSSTLEEFYFNVDDAIATGTPFIYILDSMDSLDTEADDKKFDQQKKAYRKAQARAAGEADTEKVEKVAGSYALSKAKGNSASLRKVLKGLRDSDSILIILSQTRDNIGAMYGGKTRSGGHALRFYATTEIWSSIGEHLKKVVRGKSREIGVRVELRVKKNRQTGKLFTVSTDIYPSYGIDDIGSCIDYLVEEGWWTIQKQSIVAKELNFTATRDKLIHLIETNGLVDELKTIVEKCWVEIDEACSLQRSPRYRE
jgi:RecA/RadA recombinase